MNLSVGFNVIKAYVKPTTSGGSVRFGRGAGPRLVINGRCVTDRDDAMVEDEDENEVSKEIQDRAYA